MKNIIEIMKTNINYQKILNILMKNYKMIDCNK